MDAIGTVEAVKLLKNLNKGYALLDGVRVPDTIKINPEKSSGFGGTGNGASSPANVTLN